MIRKVPIHATMYNNDSVQETLNGKGKTYYTKMNLFLSIMIMLYIMFFLFFYLETC